MTIYESSPAVIVETCRHFPFRERPRHDVAWHRVTRFLCLFSRFFNAYTRAIANANINYCERWSESSSETQTKKKLARSIRNYKCRIARHVVRRSVLRRSDSHRSFFLIILGRSFFPGPFFFLFLRRFYVVNRPRTYLSPLPVPPTPPPCSAFYGPRTGPIFLPRQLPFLPSLLPLLREPTAVLFLIYIFAVRSHLRSFAFPLPPRSSLLLSISLNLFRSETTCLSHGKISIVHRDIARTEMSCRRCRELASSFDRYTW